MGVLTKVWAGDREAAEMVSGVGFKPETLPPEGAREEREGRVTKGPLAKNGSQPLALLQGGAGK